MAKKKLAQIITEGANTLGNFAQTAGTVIGTVGAITGNPLLQTIGEVAGIGGTAVEGLSNAAGRFQEGQAEKEAAKTSASPALPPAQLTPEEQRQLEINNELNEMKRQQGLPSSPTQPSQGQSSQTSSQPTESSGMSVEEFSKAFEGLANKFLKKAEPNTESEKTPAPAFESKVSSPDNPGQERYYDLLDKHHALLDKYHELLNGGYSSSREGSREGATMRMERVKPRSRSRSRYEDPNERLIMQQREYLDNIWDDNDGLEGATMRMIRL